MTTPRREVLADGIEIWLGDCRDVLPLIGQVDAVVTDQPYGSGWVSGGGAVGKFKAEGAAPVWDQWDTGWIRLVSGRTIAAFGPCSRLSDLIAALGGGSLRFYVKKNPRPPLGGSDAPSVEPIVVFPRVLFGDGPQHLVAYNGDNEFHPTQKPLVVIEWLVKGVSTTGDAVCDPFMGSGTTGVACVNLGRSFIGIERDVKYFDVARRRISEALACPRLPFDEPVRSVQALLFEATA